jgi:hypothetical protein
MGASPVTNLHFAGANVICNGASSPVQQVQGQSPSIPEIGRTGTVPTRASSPISAPDKEKIISSLKRIIADSKFIIERLNSLPRHKRYTCSWKVFSHKTITDLKHDLTPLVKGFDKDFLRKKKVKVARENLPNMIKAMDEDGYFMNPVKEQIRARLAGIGISLEQVRILLRG